MFVGIPIHPTWKWCEIGPAGCKIKYMMIFVAHVRHGRPPRRQPYMKTIKKSDAYTKGGCLFCFVCFSVLFFDFLIRIPDPLLIFVDVIVVPDNFLLKCYW